MSNKLTPWTGDPVPVEQDDEFVVDPVFLWGGLGAIAVIAIIATIISMKHKSAK